MDVRGVELAQELSPVELRCQRPSLPLPSGAYGLQ